MRDFLTTGFIAPNDLLDLVAGDEIGRGQYRAVYECKLMPGCVLKQDTGENHSNIFEYSIWKEFEGTPLEKWLCPVEWMSPRGHWLVMRRTRPIAGGKFPKRIPALLACDIKSENWGWYRGRPVCHDYGNSALFSAARKSLAKLESVIWERVV